MAARKAANTDNYSKLFPEYSLVFIGDSGHGDPMTGEAILAAHPGVVTAVIIHDVVATPAARRREWAAKGLHFVDTYVGAATLLLARGLISSTGADSVLAQTRAGLDEVAWSSPAQEAAMRALVDRDAAGLGHTGVTN